MTISFSTVAIYITISYFIFIIFFVSKKLPTPIKSIEDFFSLDQTSQTQTLTANITKSFEATNASFAAGFITLFLYSLKNFFYGLSLCFGYVIGIFIFTYFFIPKLSLFYSKDQCFPEALGEKTESKLLEVLTAGIVLISLILFYYSEFNAYTRQFLAADSTNSVLTSLILGFILLILCCWYVIVGGYRSVVFTDVLQSWLIRLGSLGLLVLTLLNFYQTGFSPLWNIIKNDLSYEFPIVLLLSVGGLSFSQITYFDNWQRFVVWRKASVNKDDSINVLEIQRNFYFSAFLLFIIYLVPVLLAVYAKHHGFSNVFSTLNFVWGKGLFEKIILVFSLLAFISALLSTVDTYLVAFLYIVHRNFFSLSLTSCRQLAFLVTIFIWPFIVYDIPMDKWLSFLFYANNALVGPIFVMILGYKPSRIVALWSVILLTLLIFLAYVFSKDILDLLNLIVLITSISVNWWARKKNV